MGVGIISIVVKTIKIVKFLLKPQMGIRILGKTSFEPLAMFIGITMRSGQVSNRSKR